MNAKLQAIVDKLSGLDEGKIEVKDIKEIKAGTWVLRYKEKGKSAVQTIESKDYDELDQIRQEFGGDNLETCMAEDKFLSLDMSWNATDLLRLGHRITKIKLRGNCVLRNDRKSIKMDEGTGERDTISSDKNEKDEVGFISNYTESCEFTRSFSDYTEFNKLLEFISGQEELRRLKWKVHAMCTEAVATKDQCVWKRGRAGDGTTRMILELQELNGVSFKKCLRQELHRAAGDMFHTPCSRIGIRPKEKVKVICQWAAENGQVSVEGFEAAV